MSKATRPIPTRPNLERDRKEAKVLVRDFRSADLRCLERIRSSHPSFRKSSPEAVRRSRFALRDAQLVLAREYGFESWAAWKDYVESPARRLATATTEGSSTGYTRVSSRALPIARALMAQGADMRAPDSQGVTPVDHLAGGPGGSGRAVERSSAL